MSQATAVPPRGAGRALRTLTVWATAALLALTAVGCSAGRGALTSQAHSLGDGIDYTAGPIRVANALLIVPAQPVTSAASPATSPATSLSSSSSAPSPASTPTSSPAEQTPAPSTPSPSTPSATAPFLSMMLTNTTDAPVHLRSIDVAGVGPATLNGTTTIAARGAITVGQAGQSTTQASVGTYTDPAGSTLSLTLTFSDGTVIANLQTVAIADPNAPEATTAATAPPASPH